MKRVLTAMLCLALAGLIGGGPLVLRAAAENDNPEIAVSVRYDFDNLVRAGVVVPAFIHIENSGKAFDGVLRINITPNQSEQAYVYEMAVHVPQESKADFTMPFRVCERDPDLHVQLLQGGRVTARATTASPKIRYSDRLLVGVLSDNHAGIDFRNYFDTILDDDGRAVRVKAVDLSPEDFPEEIYLLDRFALLLLNHFDLQYLNEAQQEALALWVRGGGRLLVDADANNKQAVASLAPIIELQVIGTLPASPEPEPAAPGDDEAADSDAAPEDDEIAGRDVQGLGKVAPDGILLLGSAARPLISVHGVGQGKVFVTSFPLDSPGLETLGVSILSFQQIPGMSAHAADYLDATALSYNSSIDSSMNEAVRSIAWLDAPPIAWVVSLLLLFIIVAAPVSYFFLAKRDKRDWIWLTAPVLSVLVCVVIMGYGVVKHGTQTVSSVATVVDLRDRSRSAQSYSLVGIAAPRLGSYEIGLGEDAFPYELMERNYYYYYEPDEDPTPGVPVVRFDLSGFPKVTYPQIRQWSMQTFYLLRDIPVEGQLRVDVHSRVDGLGYVIRNDTGYLIEDVTLTSSLGYARIPRMESGEEVSGTIRSSADQPDAFASQPNYMSFYSFDSLYGVRQLYRHDDESLTEGERRERHLKSLLVSAPFDGGATSTFTGSLALWGWSSELGALSMTANGKPVRNDLNQAVVIGAAAFTYEANNEINIPTGYILGYIRDFEDQLNGYDLYGQRSAYLTQGSITFQLDLPGLEDYRIDEMLITCTEVSGDPVTHLYNNRTGDWDPYELGTLLSGEDAQAAKAYIDDIGAVLVKISVPEPEEDSAAGDMVYIDSVTIGITGEEDLRARD